TTKRAQTKLPPANAGHVYKLDDAGVRHDESSLCRLDQLRGGRFHRIGPPNYSWLLLPFRLDWIGMFSHNRRIFWLWQPRTNCYAMEEHCEHTKTRHKEANRFCSPLPIGITRRNYRIFRKAVSLGIIDVMQRIDDMSSLY